MKHLHRNHYHDAQIIVGPLSRDSGNDLDIIVTATKRTDQSKLPICQRADVMVPDAAKPSGTKCLIVRGSILGRRSFVSRQSRRAYCGGPSAGTRFKPSHLATEAGAPTVFGI
jgi:hypothetical protein